MAIVRVYFHRTPARVGPHLRYIATREGACGLQGLGPAFRALRGDADACTRLLLEHAEQARKRVGGTTREGAFVRLLFTLPSDTAARVSAADARLEEGSRLVLRDAIEATFRSAGASRACTRSTSTLPGARPTATFTWTSARSTFTAGRPSSPRSSASAFARRGRVKSHARFSASSNARQRWGAAPQCLRPPRPCGIRRLRRRV